MVSVWFTSNTNFSKDSNNNKEIITKWNNKVRKEDIIYFLGGFGDFTYADKLNGNIIYITNKEETSNLVADIIKQPIITNVFNSIEYQLLVVDKEEVTGNKIVGNKSTKSISVTMEENNYEVLSIEDIEIKLSEKLNTK